MTLDNNETEEEPQEQEKKEEEPEENYDFDFTQYEEDDEEDEKHFRIESIKTLERPQVTGIRSRFSMGEKDFERLADIKNRTTDLSIKVAARTQDLNTLWTYYSTLLEYWETIRNIYGELVNKEMDGYFEAAEVKLDEAAEAGTIHKDVHLSLLTIRSKIYRLAQLSNLSFETERVSSNQFSRTKRSIVQ